MKAAFLFLDLFTVESNAVQFSACAVLVSNTNVVTLYNACVATRVGRNLLGYYTLCSSEVLFSLYIHRNWLWLLEKCKHEDACRKVVDSGDKMHHVRINFAVLEVELIKIFSVLDQIRPTTTPLPPLEVKLLFNSYMLQLVLWMFSCSVNLLNDDYLIQAFLLKIKHSET